MSLPFPPEVFPYILAADLVTGEIRPTAEDGDDYYGLSPFAAGVAKEARRRLVEGEITRLYAYTGPVRWRRYNGSPALGLNLHFPPVPVV